MARGLNKAMLIGRLGKDPELKYTPNGTPVATFSMATDDSYKDANGQTVTKTEWHNIVCWRKLAEIAGEYLKKGKLIYLEGKISTRSYEDKDGNKKYFTEIVADTFNMLDRKDSAGTGEESDVIPVPAIEGSGKQEEDLPF